MFGKGGEPYMGDLAFYGGLENPLETMPAFTGKHYSVT